MRNKILIIIAMLAVMVVMTGTAVAYDALLYSADGSRATAQSLDIVRGSSINLSYHGENIIASAIGTDLPYSYKVVALAGGAAVGDITVTLPANFHPTATTFTDIGVINIALRTSAPIGAKYRVTIRGGDEDVDIDFGSASINFGAIPQFPTVALPVAAVIGLVFFFQQKNYKKE